MKKSIVVLTAMFALLASLISPTVALAADSPADVARAHFAAIARGDQAALGVSYRQDSFVWWVGGPLDGSYDGKLIPELWTKFAATGPYTAEVIKMESAVNPKGATVSAWVTYATPQRSIKVLQVLVIRDGKIQDEIWQVAPPAATT